MKRLFTLALLVAGSVTALSAQEARRIPELRTFIGATIPTGNQADFIKAGPLVGLQGAFELRQTLHLLGTFSWAPVKDKFPVGQHGVNILQYDAGVEAGMNHDLSDGWFFHPFIGAGAGARTYLYDDNSLEDKTGAAVYGALGTEFQLNRLALRIEARDYVYNYPSPIPGVKSKTRNEIGFTFGLAYHLR